MLSAGYLDRIAFVGVLVLGASGLLSFWWAAAYVAVTTLDVAVALAAAGVLAQAPAYVLSLVLLFPLDIAGSFTATVAQLLRRPRGWLNPRARKGVLYRYDAEHTRDQGSSRTDGP